MNAFTVSAAVTAGQAVTQYQTAQVEKARRLEVLAYLVAGAAVLFVLARR